MPKRGGLGRGLDALIPNKRQKGTATGDKNESTAKKNVTAGSSSGTSKNAVKKKTDTAPANKSKEKQAKAGKPADISDEARKMADAIISGKALNNEEILPESEEIIETDQSKNEENDLPVSENPADTEADSETIEDTETVEDVLGSGMTADTEEQPKEEEHAEELIPSETNEEIDKGIVHLKISEVEPNRLQPRKYFDEEAIEELADSIRQFGIISPLLVQKKDGYYEIIAGERRWRAAKKAGLKEVPVIIREFSSQEAVEISLIENIQREDLNPIEEARAYERLTVEYGLAQEEVAGRVSKSRSAVANSMRLLKLSPEVQKLVETGELSEGHARTIIPIIAPEMQNAVSEQIIKERLSVRQTEKLVRDLLHPGKKTVRMRDERRMTLLSNLSENLKAALGTKVSIHQNGKNKGKIEIEYYSDDELDRLYELLRSIPGMK